ncbi:MAG: glycoside hydrolase family 3 N-terminal domain-containing protein [Chloroflexota bacterium]|nr:glycoside hydrolase family 3 N-terminal domain-containing protein [Chloroflexota bacterium]
MKAFRLFIIAFSLSVLMLAAASVRVVVAQSDRVESLLAALTLEHKVAQMFMVTLHGSVLTEVGAAHLRTWQPGGLVMFGANVGAPDAVARLTNGYQRTITEAGGVPVLISIDQEGGVVNRLTDGFTFVPTPLLLTASGMSEDAGRVMGGELNAVGINMNLAPVADLETYRDNPIIARRAFGSDPIMSGEAVAGFVRGTQARGVLATAKHFPGHGETREDSHASLPTVDLDRVRLESVELAPFRAAIAADVAAVMVSHIWFPAFDTTRRPASLSPVLVSDLLRDQMGYDGLIMTDALDMNAVDLEVNYYDAVVMAIEAGVDLLATGPSTGLQVAEAAMQRVVDEVRAGTIDEARIDESVRRILTTKDRFGLLDWTPIDPATAAAAVTAENGAALVESLYRRGVTVAYDRRDLVPVPADARVAVIFLATRYQIQTECSLYRPDGVGIQWVGVNDNPTQEQIDWASEAARSADTVIVWTQNADRNPEQTALVRALPPDKTIVVALWSPYDWQAFPDVASYVATYSPGRPAVPAACAVLFGAAESVGRLPVTLRLDLPAGSAE